jgi:hypothetical protein
VRGCSPEKLQATHGSGSTMSHISRALTHATTLLILPLTYQLRRDLQPTLRLVRGRPILSLFCADSTRANTNSYIACG